MGSRGANSGVDRAWRKAILEKYPDAVIGEFKDGKVTFKYSPKGREYEYSAKDLKTLGEKLGARLGGKGFEGNSFFGNTKDTSRQYFKMEKQVSGDTVAFATRNIVVRNGTPVLIVGDGEGIYLKNSQWRAVGIKNGDRYTDAIMVKMNRNEFDGAKRYKVNTGDINTGAVSFDSLKDTAKQQERGGNQYKTYTAAIYDRHIDTSGGKKGRKIV